MADPEPTLPAQPDRMETPEPPRKTCRCGHSRGHHMVSADPEYTAWGWLRLVVGISTRPTRIKYRCRRCDQVVESTTAAAELDNYY
jgi:hypothetical protein